ncbi:MAG TPA: arginine--tRNA ligase [candidate division Zixibacteria bacterium]|nr:arginine--tRNA ligase [candidate division Zixibacteria bacterium]
MESFKTEIAKKLAEKTGRGWEELVKAIEVPPQAEFGDFAFPCHGLAKVMRKNPAQIAAELASTIVIGDRLKKVQAVAGYVNFWVDRTRASQEVLKKIFGDGESYGSSSLGNGKTIALDYSSPNIAKHFGVGHLRSTAIGHSLYHIFKKLGYRVVGINHLGDWGTQFGQLIAAFKKWGSEEELKCDPVSHLFELYVRFNKEAKDSPQLAEEARGWFKKLEEGNSETQKIWQHFKDLSLAEFARIYAALGIHFDHFTGESFYNDKMERVIKLLAEKKLSKISEEALIVDLSAFDMPPLLLKKKDEATLYSTRDLAAAIYRWESFQFEKSLYVVGVAQSLHFKQLFKTLELAGYPWASRLVHVSFGWVKFGDAVMSTREGNIVFLKEVLEKGIELAEKTIREKNPQLKDLDKTARMIAVGAIMFADLSARRQKDITFRWEEVLNFEGETGPYLQYTYARLASLLRKYGKSVKSDVNFDLLATEPVWPVVRQLGNFPSTVLAAAEAYEPSFIATYLLDLAKAFNAFYQTERILTDDTAATDAKMLLCSGVKSVLKEGLYLLGIESPEEM